MATARRRQYRSGSLHQRKSDGMWIGTLEAGWTATGARRRITVSSKDKAECGRKLRAKAKELADKTHSPANARETVKSYSERWLKATETKLRPNTQQANATAVNKWIVPTIGHVRLSEITADHVRQVTAAIRSAGLSMGSMDRTHGVLIKMLRDASIDEYRISPGVFALERPGKGETDRAAMTLPQALAMIGAIEKEPDPSRWVAMILNGMRQGERLGLTWDMIDFDRQQIDVSWQLQLLPYLDKADRSKGFRVPDGYKFIHLNGAACLVRPKTTRSQRVIPMTSWLRDSLLHWREIAPASPHGLVWCRDDGQPIEDRYDRLEWVRLQEVAGVKHPTGRPFKPHEGRHTTVTLLKELGIANEIIEQIVGHTKLIAAYQHHDLLPHSRAALEALGERLGLTASVQLEPGANG